MSESVIADDLFDNLASLFGDINQDVSSSVWEREVVLENYVEAFNPKRTSDVDSDLSGKVHKRLKPAEDYNNSRVESEARSWRLFLLRIPKLIVDAVNTGDIEKISEVIEQACTEDCFFKPPALIQHMTGRSHVIEFFQLFSHIFPDTVLHLHKTKLIDGVVKSVISFCATKTFDHPNEAKFCDFKDSNKTEDAEFREKAKEIEAHGGNYVISGTMTLNFFLDKSLVKVVRIELEKELQDIQMAERPDCIAFPVAIDPRQVRALAIYRPSYCIMPSSCSESPSNGDDEDDDGQGSDESTQDGIVALQQHRPSFQSDFIKTAVSGYVSGHSEDGDGDRTDHGESSDSSSRSGSELSSGEAAVTSKDLFDNTESGPRGVIIDSGI